MPFPNSELPLLSPSQLLLPPRLARPSYRAIDFGAALIAIDPALQEVPVVYLEHFLRGFGAELLEATPRAPATIPVGPMPKELQVICTDVSVEPPTHILAVTSSPGLPPNFVPIHALFMAISCANLPPFPLSHPEEPATPGELVTIPVVPLLLPSPATFPILLSYIYSKRLDLVLAEVLPAENGWSMMHLAREHATTCSVRTLTEHARKLYGLWNNITALGVFDIPLFQSLELAWEVLLNALAISLGQNVMNGIVVDL